MLKTVDRIKALGWRSFYLALPLASALVLWSAAGTESAIANGDTRTINLVNAHTKESISATFMVNGQYDSAVLAKLNWFLRDWRLDKGTSMDPHLFDIVWNAYRLSGSREPIVVLSGYRSPQTNAMLRRRSRLVAKFSQHILGKAMDQHYVDVPMSKIREIAMKMQRGGVGYYPTSGTPFVHMDAGNVRSWPRMSYEQLARLFPDGKTVHIPSNGQPLSGYEEARREIIATGTAYAPISSVGKSKSFFARLFSGDGGDEGEASRGTQQLASLNINNDGNSRVFYQVAPQAAPQAPASNGQASQPIAVSHAPMAAANARLVSLPTPSTQLALLNTKPKQDLIAGVIAKTADVQADRALPAKTALPSISLPLPPERPNALLASLAAPIVPLPPTLPVQLASLDPNYIGYNNRAPSSAMAALTHGKPTVLPDIITQGDQSDELKTGQAQFAAGQTALAYADMPARSAASKNRSLTASAIPHFKLRTLHAKTMPSPPVGDNASLRGLKTAHAAHNFRSNSVVGSVAPGLRSAIHAQSASLFGEATNGVHSTFMAQLLTMPTDRFSRDN